MFSAPKSRRASLAFQLWAVLAIGAIGLSFVIATVVTDREREDRLAREHATAERAALALARRAAPLLDRGDDLRLAVLAASVADVSAARVLLLDRTGVVRLDTGLSLGGNRLTIETTDGPIDRSLDDEDQTWEVLAPALANSGFAGEVRLRYRPYASADVGYAWEVFGIALLCGLSLVVVAWWLAHHWVLQLQNAVARVRAIGDGDTEGEAPKVPLSGTAFGEIAEAVRDVDQEIEAERVRSREAGFELARRLVKSLEQRGLAVSGHGERTRRYARMLAEAIELEEPCIAELETAASLIEVGKACVRSSALRKVDDLSSIERESLRYAPARGASFLAGLPASTGIVAAIRHHREKYDGTGFPDGLRGERIPIAARILAIADAYDLLTSTTQCGVGLSWPEALERLHDDRGEHFDPSLLDVFEAEMRRNPSPSAAHGSVVIATPDRRNSTLRPAPYKLTEEGSGEGFEIEHEDVAIDDVESVIDSIEFEVLNDEANPNEESTG